jgi:nucleoside-diphosphate-sugar epimerase
VDVSTRRPVRRVLVTGATGFVGGAVVRALADSGRHPVALVRSRQGLGGLHALGATVVTGDMTEPATYRDVVAEVDAVVHAAQTRVTGRVTARALAALARDDEVATSTLVEACRAGGTRLVYTSGCDHGDAWVTEETPLAPAPLSAGHTRQVRRLRQEAARGLDVVVLHLGFVYGPGGTFQRVFYEQARSGRLRTIGRGANYWSVVHVDDAAAAYVAALDYAPAGAEYNVVDDHPLRQRELVDHLTDAVGKRRVGSVPVALAGLVAGRAAALSLATSYRVSNRRARDELGWTPAYPRFTDGLPVTVAAIEARVTPPRRGGR